ncbi:class II aldolase/adducin family protein [Roseomonas sp. BN140053]|uniref:class II aldolase/adducin family protein n=1 Tax=Roseomonas sp. BN140053 TaxID=3391898 RepID=UPI0039E86C95
MPAEDGSLDALLGDLVIANRILAREGVVDDFGHVSVRDPADPGHFWLSCSRSPELVAREDLLRFDLDAVPENRGHRRPYIESILHARIFAARPDVNAVVHHHARAVLPFTISSRKLRPVFHLGAVIGDEVPLWDSTPEFGDTCMLIDDAPKADSLARALRGNPTALLRSHGAVCVGGNLPQAVFVSIYMKENAELQLQSEAGGHELRFLSPGEIRLTQASQFSEGPMSRSWNYRRARAGFGGL